MGLLLSEKQIPQVVVNIKNGPYRMEPLEVVPNPLGAGGRAFKSPRPEQRNVPTDGGLPPGVGMAPDAAGNTAVAEINITKIARDVEGWASDWWLAW